MINIDVAPTQQPGRFNFALRVEEDGEVQLIIRGCSVVKGHVNGPAIKLGAYWLHQAEFHGEFKSAIIKSLEPLRALYPGVEWPKE